EGSLCAQLCLNNLLQEEYFRPGELSSVAHQLDESTGEDYHTVLQQPSGNMDHRVFFSIQVISNALKVWGLELILFSSYKKYWFIVRKLGKQWFNLKSLLTGYSIFVVKDDLPDCDQLLQKIRVQQMHQPKLIGEELAQLKEQRVQKTGLEHMSGFAKGSGTKSPRIDMEGEKADLCRAIKHSMQDIFSNTCQDIPRTSVSHFTLEELWKR
ncbi:hypothetical protein FD755_012226, partial [Muntiacus reevesi]